MLGSPLREEERQIDIQLPNVERCPALTAPPDEIVVNIYADGHVVVDQKAVSAEELTDLLSAAQTRYKDQSVLIRGEGKGNYQSVMDVLSICQKANIRNYSLATQLKPE